MKKIFLITTIVASLVTLTWSCRKGPNDPFFSIRSRSSRLVGIWKISDIIIDSTVYRDNGISTSNPETKNPTSYQDSLKLSIIGADEKDSVYYETLVVNEDGTYSDTIKSRKWINATTPTKYSTRVISNNWYWLDSKKNKEGIMFLGYGTFLIDRLAWKELNLIYTKKTIRKISSNTTTISVIKRINFKRN